MDATRAVGRWAAQTCAKVFADVRGKQSDAVQRAEATAREESGAEYFAKHYLDGLGPPGGARPWPLWVSTPHPSERVSSFTETMRQGMMEARGNTDTRMDSFIRGAGCAACEERLIGGRTCRSGEHGTCPSSTWGPLWGGSPPRLEIADDGNPLCPRCQRKTACEVSFTTMDPRGLVRFVCRECDLDTAAILSDVERGPVGPDNAILMPPPSPAPTCWKCGDAVARTDLGAGTDGRVWCPECVAEFAIWQNAQNEAAAVRAMAEEDERAREEARKAKRRRMLLGLERGDDPRMIGTMGLDLLDPRRRP